MMCVGEQFHILVHVRAEDPSGPEILTPFKVAAAMKNLAVKNTEEEFSGASEADKDSVTGDAQTGTSDAQSGAIYTSEDKITDEPRSTKWTLKLGTVSGEYSLPNSSEYSDSPTTILNQEGKRKRTFTLLENFRKSHYYVRILKEDEPLWKKPVVGSVESPQPGGEGKASDEHKRIKEVGTYGCTAVPIEEGRFDPHSAGGIARHAVGCSLLANGDIVVGFSLLLSCQTRN